MSGDVTGGERAADIVRSEAPPGRAERAGAALQAACGERHIGGDADVAGPDPLGDPVIRGIRPLGDEDEAQPLIDGHADIALGHHEDGEDVPLGDGKDLLAYRAGIGVDIDVEHGAAPLPGCRPKSSLPGHLNADLTDAMLPMAARGRPDLASLEPS